MSEKLAIGVDIGGTHIKYALVSKQGEVLWHNEIPTAAEQSRSDLINSIAQCILEAKSQAEHRGVIYGVGIGTSGLVNIDQGLVMGGAPNLPDWNNLPLSNMLQEKVDLPVFVDNDANLMGLGEYIFGLKSEGENLIFLTIGTGIGGAIIINKQLYRGYRNAGAELGCIPMTYEGETGYWEDFASTGALVDQYLDKSGSKKQQGINGRYIVDAFHKGEELAVEAINEHTRLIGMGVAGLINIFNPENVVIGGGISEAGDFYIDKIRDNTNLYAMEDCLNGVVISKAQLGNKAGFLGAAHFVFTQLNNDRI